MRRLEYYSIEGPNSLWYWSRIVNPLAVIKNFVVIEMCRYSPSFRLKNFLYRNFLGTEVGPYSAIGLMVMLDIFFPQRISIGSGVTIGYNSTILCHEFLHREYRLGDVVIEDGAAIGANTTILPGVVIGEGATVSACSLVNKDVPPHTFVGGVPAKILTRNRRENTEENQEKRSGS